jgi:glycerol-3-phosphate dehydrogenase (NAD(P)+)
VLASRNAPTVLWARRPELAEEVDRAHTNTSYLPNHLLPPELAATASLEEAVTGADVVVMGVPSHGMRATLRALAPFVTPGVPVVSLAKGLEQGTDLRMTEVVAAELPGHPAGVLTGPNLAREVLSGHAAATVVAFTDTEVAESLQRLFTGDLFRVYTNHDVIGCEVAGALKNVMAIASGMADGLGTGDNTRAAVITRGLAELSRLGLAMGGELLTFSGLAGMGDLVATCISPQSRNRYVGEQLGRGRTLDQVVAEMNMVAEGIKTSAVTVELADRYGVDMPIAREVYAVVHEGRSAAEAYRGLLCRELRSEAHGMS